MDDWLKILSGRGGRAFPSTVKNADGSTHTFVGMTLRDYFAAQALAAIIQATADCDTVNAMASGVKGGTLEVKAAYAWADVMIVAREAL